VLLINYKKYPLNVTAVRRAIAFAIPYQDLINKAYFNYSVFCLFENDIIAHFIKYRTDMEALLLLVVGVGIGALSGFFGIGGGTVLVPVLMLMGFGFKHAVGISIMQMVFSSVYGSYLNIKRGSLEFGEGLFVGFGGFVGGYISGYISPYIPDRILQIFTT